MNAGGEPERDDTGLPPIDIEIPDDARELERDMLAYHREQRAERRRSRNSRVHRLLAKDGIAMPLLACCLIFALITGTLLTVFTASGIDQGLPGAPGKPGASLPNGTAGAAAGGAAEIPQVYSGASLPAATITETGRPQQLRQVRSSAFLLVPRDCNCSVALAEVATLMSRSRVPTLLVIQSGVPSSEFAVAMQDGASLASDPSGALRRTYPASGLTAVLVAANGTVHYADQLVYQDNLAYLLWAVGVLRQLPTRRQPNPTGWLRFATSASRLGDEGSMP